MNIFKRKKAHEGPRVTRPELTIEVEVRRNGNERYIVSEDWGAYGYLYLGSFTTLEKARAYLDEIQGNEVAYRERVYP